MAVNRRYSLSYRPYSPLFYLGIDSPSPTPINGVVLFRREMARSLLAPQGPTSAMKTPFHRAGRIGASRLCLSRKTANLLLFLVFQDKAFSLFTAFSGEGRSLKRFFNGLLKTRAQTRA